MGNYLFFSLRNMAVDTMNAITRHHENLLGDVKSFAVFSPCEKYRYRLQRRWADGPLMVWVMLNPSTADEMANDPTVERCEKRARDMGFAGLEVVNIFAFRSTDPSGLLTINDPVGPDNDKMILAATKDAGMIVCGWGTHGHLNGRGKAVHRMLIKNERKPYALRVTQCGNPGHPLYVSYKVQPVPYELVETTA